MLLTTLTLAAIVGQGPSDWLSRFRPTKSSAMFTTSLKDLATFLIATPEDTSSSIAAERTALIQKSVESLG